MIPHSDTDLPPGMIPWNGTGTHPDDWDEEKPVLSRNGIQWIPIHHDIDRWQDDGDVWDIIAYTPKMIIYGQDSTQSESASPVALSSTDQFIHKVARLTHSGDDGYDAGMDDLTPDVLDNVIGEARELLSSPSSGR